MGEIRTATTFVVRAVREDGGSFGGTVERVQTGQKARFEGTLDLADVVARLLAVADDDPAPPTPVDLHGAAVQSDDENRAAMVDMAMAYRLTQVIHAAASLGLADALASGPMSASALAEQAGAEPRSLVRLLRALVGIGVLECGHDDTFVLTRLGTWLRTEVPGSVAPLVRFFGGGRSWLGWGRLADSVRSSQPSLGPRSQRAFLDRHETDPEAAATFDAAMTAVTSVHARAVLRVYDFSRYAVMVDVGGGHGTLLAAILAAYPGTRGILFDLPPVVAGAHAILEHAGVADRCEVIGGDCFVSVPAGGDLYVLKAIIHDWDDTRVLAILRNCRAVMPTHARLLLVERVLPDAMEASARCRDVAFSDLNMLVLAGGQERTESEFRALLGRAGFRLARVVPAPPLCVLEAIPEEAP